MEADNETHAALALALGELRALRQAAEAMAGLLEREADLWTREKDVTGAEVTRVLQRVAGGVRVLGAMGRRQGWPDP